MRQSAVLTDKKTQGQQLASLLGHTTISANPDHVLATGLDNHTHPFQQQATNTGFSALPVHEDGRSFTDIRVRTPVPSVPPNYATPACPAFPRRCPFGGACHVCPVTVQAKLAINQPGDSYEQEADLIAEQVMAMSVHSKVSDAPSRILRFTGQSPARQTDIAPASVDQALAGFGRPLGPALRQDMEQRFGYDFSQVRVRTGDAAEQSAREVNAKAYTVGNNVVFGAGQFAPETNEGRRLLAHELTHVVQQGSERCVSAVGSKMLQRSLGTYIKAMQEKPEPDWKTAAEHLNGESPQKIKIILKNLSSHYRAKLHEAARKWPGLCSNIGRLTEADYLKEHPETTSHVADACEKKPEPPLGVPPSAPAPAPPAPPTTASPSTPAPPTPKDCSASGEQKMAINCTPNPHGSHLPDVGRTHPELHPIEPCRLMQAAVAASSDWCVDSQQAHGGEICYREIPKTSGAPGDQYCYSKNCCHNSADAVSVVSPESSGRNSCCKTDIASLPGHIWKDVVPEFRKDPKRVFKDILGL